MQYLKEDVKERILESALKEFKEKGYLDSSMRNIANNAGVALGNVYRYFENKESLFNAIIEPIYDRLMRYIFNLKNIKREFIDPIDELLEIKNKILEIFKENSTELLILMDKSKGSKYEGIKDDLTLYIDNILKQHLVPQLKDKGVKLKNDFITYVLSATVVEGVCVILRNNDDGIQIGYLIEQLISIYFNDIEKRII